MTYSIEAGKHSADKDHRVMTGGTLSVDKTIQCSEGVTFYTYEIPFYQGGEFDESFHKGVHTAEHMIAYKKDTGSVRNSLEEVSNGKISGKVILDISPYKTGVDNYGFRITSMIPLPVEQVQNLVKISIDRALVFLEKGDAENKDDFEGIPFARSISCGQFNFHNKKRAISDLRAVDMENLHIQEVQFSSKHTTAYVCDLRFLKPKVSVDDNLVMFTPEMSYRISKLIEEELPKKLSGSIALVGTFGCMTGMYLCISSEIGDEGDIKYIHAMIIEVLKENIDRNILGENEKVQFDALLENYNLFGNK